MGMDPHRSALDHVLRLIAESPWADSLMLRGSMAMPAWVGDRARPPGDLDLVMLHPPLAAPDDLAPWPFVERIDPAQHWPEAVHGGARNEIWTFEEFETGGQCPRLPPEGLHWMTVADLNATSPSHEFVLDLIRADPWTPEGVVLHVAEIDDEEETDYTDYSDDDEYADMGPIRGRRTRLRIPWSAPDFEIGKVQLDVAWDEPVPARPRLTVVPRAEGRAPVAVFTPGPELSLAWKLHWLTADQVDQGVSAAKDLYDAVLLAELPALRLPPRLHRLATTVPAAGPVPAPPPVPSGPAFRPADLGSGPTPAPPRAVLTPAAVRAWKIDGSLPGGPAPWLDRLATALPHLSP
ncbi:hypothetical protein BJY16_002214 [Actinoplanes octamycinicus]|uniref:Nucleotidyltransferase AbiEii toxin of type IV toxin-antitoxin system n=1 Tax=Actinoplanes octamycinicus TaxID=135948 RepID=A0A7W7GUW1_9ACTN|nr:nucleotidyl transferase AbiEii/AbiGii toxin family protein [Actinoplanes octamycinicus]MBB4738755.1 hypothetical protein [Actinoplanes octamycinicus]GIE61489.1 hypothetical protein Aoc01nite_68910 [Actinoplanes octamycinicus]